MAKRPRVRSPTESSDEEDHQPAPHKKRRRAASSSPGPSTRKSADGDSDLDVLNSDDQMEEEDGAEGEGQDGTDAGRNGGQVALVNYRPEYERGSDGYVAGSITRIKMNNFMTYDHVEFNPGPHLNMILGPNGTGKSSIAAAIAIGLGFPPKVMGRANELKAYVKQGADDAMVEIELKGKKGKRNTVIWRKFNREDEKSEWKLDGETTTRKEVLTRVQLSGIQANNLCSFLPQDKVAEFAKMAPVTVLKETMRAAGDPRLSKWHETLVEKGAKTKELQAGFETHVTTRDRLQTQVDGLAPDVAHVQEREAKEREAEILTHLVRVAEHLEAKKTLSEARKRHERLTRKADKIKMKRTPLLALQELWDKKVEKADVRVRATEEKVQGGMKLMRQRLNHAEDVGSKGRTVDDQLLQLRTKHQRREDEKNLLKDKIQKAQDVLEEPREELDAAIKDKHRARNELNSKVRQMKSQIEEVVDEYNDSQKNLDSLNNELSRNNRQRHLENIDVQKENAARDMDPSIGFGLDWLAKEGHTLQGPVYKPPMISVSVPNKEYAWQVEACTSINQRKSFVCTNQADYDRLLDLNNQMYPPRIRSDGRRVEGGKVRLNLVMIDLDKENPNPPRPCSPERLQQLSFDGFAIDFVEAEPAVLAFLCTRANMHLTALTQKRTHEINSDALTSIGIKTWATKDNFTRATQSLYGRREFVTSTIEFTPAKAFNLSVDRDAVKRIADEIAKKKKTKLDREAPHSQLKTKMDELRAAQETVRSNIGGIDREIKEMSEKVRRYQKAATDIEAFTNKLRKIEAEPTQEEARARLKAEKLKYAQARIKPLESWQTAGDDAIKLCSEYAAQSLTLIQSLVNQDVIQSKVKEGNQAAKDISSDVDEAATTRDEAKLFVTQKWEALKRNLEAEPADLRKAVSDRSKPADLPSIEELQEKLQTLKAQLELAINIPGNIVDRYNNLLRELEAAQKTVDDEKSDLADVKRDLKRILDMFDPALDTLVQAVSAKFSAAFARVRCSGEVRVRRVEGDFAAWGIEILVSYRDGDSLAILTGSHQSGGERSLATVTYLMSLSEMSRTPFSLVDEINQGMDQRAERAVHNQLVEVTCDADAGQYFLITPKLLTGLSYHPKMKVLIINNGTHLPDSQDKSQRYGALSACIKRYAQKHAIAT